MSKLFKLSVVAVAMAFFAASATVRAEEPKPAKQPAPKDPKAEVKAPAAGGEIKCVMMDEKIDPSTRMVTDAGVVYFCCPDCIAKYKADPAKYADKVAAQQAAVAALPQAQVTCPCGMAYDAKVAGEVGGKKLHFCSDKCMEHCKEKAPTAKTIASIYTVQNKCPMCDKPIDGAAHVDFKTGQHVYFCCKACADKYKADQAAAKPNLDKMNIHVDPKTMEGA